MAETGTPDHAPVRGRFCCLATGSWTPTTCRGPSRASPTRSSSATTASTTSSLIGLQTGGVPLAERLAEALDRSRASRSPVGTLDVAFYRDDIGLRPVAARGGHRHPRRPRRRDRRARRRRALHRPHHPGRARRAHRLRPAPRGAARGARRPRPPRAADPARLRRQEPADRAATRWSTSADDGVDLGEMREVRAPALDRRPRRATASRSCSSLTDSFVEVQRARRSRRCRRCGARPSCRSSTRTRPAPGSRSRPRPSGCRPTR